MSYIPNIGWLFYKQYYWEKVGKGKDLQLKYLAEKKTNDNKRAFEDNEKVLKNRNDYITRVTLPKESKKVKQEYFIGTEKYKIPQQLTFETTYPGLLIGTGYNHGTGALGEFKLGFYFDHTTGQPIIPGSSVKGTLRSVFKRSAEYIKILLGSLEVPLDETGEDLKNKIENLEKEIFNGTRKDEKGDDKRVGIYQQDTFHDAFISKADKYGKILDTDYITPHYTSNPPQPKDLLKNPIPLMFIKIRPNVTFTFNFDLKDSEVVNGLTAGKKAELFKLILKDIGIGAKTNVGYGQFK